VSRLTLPTLALCFFYGGIIGVLGASVLEPLLIHRERFDFAAALGVGLVEEFAKIWAVAVLARRARHDSELDGLLLGAAVGMGFAALESTGYAFTAFLKSHGSITATVLVTLVRALDAPLGHGTWTAILAAVLFRESSPTRFRINGPVLGAYLTVTVLHGLWDAIPRVVAFRVPLLGIHLFAGPTLVSIVGLGLLARLWKEAVDRQAQPASMAAVPPPGIEEFGH
jgi:RsiW-degrading membrane proteinase PrsW (M82 family)